MTAQVLLRCYLLFDSRHSAQFKHEVSQLGLQQFGQPVGAKQLSVLFDSVDQDGSGYLDLKEASKALKTWQQYGQEATNDKVAKENELKRFKMRAVKKLQYALRDASSEAEPPPSSPGRAVVFTEKRGVQQAEMSPEASPMRKSKAPGEEVAEEDGDDERQRASSRRSLSALLSSRDDRTMWEKETARQVATHAIKTMDLKALRRGMSIWDAHWRRECHTRGVIIGARYAAEQAKVLRAWRRWKLTSKVKRQIQRAMDRSNWLHDAQRDGFGVWSSVAKKRLERRHRDEHLQRVVEPIRLQRLLLAYDVWMMECPPRQTSEATGKQTVKDAVMAKLEPSHGAALSKENSRSELVQELVQMPTENEPVPFTAPSTPQPKFKPSKVEDFAVLPETRQHEPSKETPSAQGPFASHIEKAPPSTEAVPAAGFWSSLFSCFEKPDPIVVHSARASTIIDADFKARARAKAAARNRSATKARLRAARDYATETSAMSMNAEALHVKASLEAYTSKEVRPLELRTSAVPQQISDRSLSSTTSDSNRMAMARNGAINVPLRPVTAADQQPLSPETQGRLAQNISQHMKFLEGFAVTLGTKHPEVVDLSC